MAPARDVTDEKCPKCGRPLEKRYTAKTGGYFLGCTGWKDKENPCTYKRDRAGKEIAGPEVTDIKCPACGKFMVKKEGRFGIFFTCEGAPDCPTTMNLGADGKPIVTALPTQNKCPKCEKHNLLLKESKAGKQVRPVPGREVQVHLGLRRRRATRSSRPDTGIVCEKCGSPMVMKVAWRGPFLVVLGLPEVPQREVDQRRAAREAQGRHHCRRCRRRAKKQKPDVPNVEIDDKCPECDGADAADEVAVRPGATIWAARSTRSARGR